MPLLPNHYLFWGLLHRRRRLAIVLPDNIKGWTSHESTRPCPIPRVIHQEGALLGKGCSIPPGWLIFAQPVPRNPDIAVVLATNTHRARRRPAVPGVPNDLENPERRIDVAFLPVPQVLWPGIGPRVVLFGRAISTAALAQPQRLQVPDRCIGITSYAKGEPVLGSPLAWGVMPMQRQGICNRCGQCCGADGPPCQDNPRPIVGVPIR